MHDLDNKDAVLAGATVTIGDAGDTIEDAGDRAGLRTTLTDDTGTFIFDDAAQPPGGISVYFGDAIAAGSLPACVDRLVWLGVHTRDANSGAPSALVVRMEDRSVDVAAVHRASERLAALADTWLSFYEEVGDVVEGSHADCAQMAFALEQFVDEHLSAIDAIEHQRAEMSSHDREQLRDTIERKLTSRSAAVQQKIKGADVCQSEPRVRRALHQIPK